MASLRVTGPKLQLGLQFKRPKRIVHCSACRRLQTSAWKRQRRLSRRSLLGLSELRADGSKTVDRQWEKIKDGMSGTVLGIWEGVTRCFRHQLNARTVALNEGHSNSKFVSMEMAGGASERDRMTSPYITVEHDGILATGQTEMEQSIKQKSDTVDSTIDCDKINDETTFNAGGGENDVWVEQILESNIVSTQIGKCSSTADVIGNLPVNDTTTIEETDKESTSGVSSRWKDGLYYFAKPKKTTSDKTKPSKDLKNTEKNLPTETEFPDKNLSDAAGKKSNSSTLTNRIKESVAGFSVNMKNSEKPSKTGEKKKEKNNKNEAEQEHAGVVLRDSDMAVPVKVKTGKQKTVVDEKSYLDIIWRLPQNIGLSLSKEKDSLQEQVANSLIQGELLAESGLVSKTKKLADSVTQASAEETKKKCLKELCNHLVLFPQFRHIASQVVPKLLQWREESNPVIAERANQALALVGYNEAPKGRGIRMMSIDGGGMRGLISIEMMKRLEETLDQPLHESFDLVIGSSTGALIGSIIFQLQVSAAECKKLYLEHGVRMFSKSSWASKVKNMAQFDAKIFEEIVKDVVGERPLIHFSRDPARAKLAITSTLTNVPRWQMFMFRNYNLPPGKMADHPGTCNAKIWEAIRASTSAPVYYREFQLGENVFMDGGCLANNPTALGIHECKLLWPDESFQCILSLGNGRFDPYLNKQVKDSSLWQIVKGLPYGFIESATDTEAVHQTLKDTVDPRCYFRLCPYLSENYDLSEVKPEKIREMLQETNTYIDKNEAFMQKVVARLKQDRLPNQKLLDFASKRRQTHSYFFF